ncbi:MAG: single-stranded DNA-binding protein [Candidatus Gracilibacteria bacterium]|nr:single-stranded DNA-binding protein [Candidatus Gracilibacteria bacterium]
MYFLNKAQIIGNVTRTPELRQTKAGQPVTTIGVATNRRWKDNGGQVHEEAEFHNIVCWGKLAELATQLLEKGAKVFFEGRLQTRNWEDEGGTKHFRTEIVAQDMIVLSDTSNNSNSNGNSSSNDESPEDEAPPPEEAGEDLPF